MRYIFRVKRFTIEFSISQGHAIVNYFALKFSSLFLFLHHSKKIATNILNSMQWKISCFHIIMVHIIWANLSYYISERFAFQYSILHAVPPQEPPKVLSECKDLTNDAGYVNVNKDYLQHVKFSNIFAIGDCSSSPNSKTMAAIGAFPTIK